MLSVITRNLIFLILFNTISALTVFGQISRQLEARELLPTQVIEREMSGAETHPYKINLQKDEFLQVRVEQKGIDILLLLLDANDKELMRMDSPNGTKGFEDLSFAADSAGSFMILVKSSSENADKGVYTIQRQASRTASVEDRKQVAFELENQSKRDQLEKLSTEAGALLDDADPSTSQEKFQAALNKATRGVEIAQSIKSLEYESLFLFILARMYEERGDNEKTLEYYEKTLKVINSNEETKINFKSNEITVLKKLGWFHLDTLNNPGEAAKLYNRALSLYGENEEDEDKGKLFRYHGDALKALKFYPQATENYLKAIQIFQRLKLNFEEGATLGKLGRAYFEQEGKAADALKYLLESEKLLENSPANSDYQSTRILNLGHIFLLYSKLNDRERVEFYRNKISKLQDKTQDPLLVFSNKFIFAMALANAGKVEDALKELHEALDFAKNSGMRENSVAQTKALEQISLLYLKIGKVKEAKEAFSKAFDLVIDLNDHSQLASILENFGDGLFNGGAFELAEEYYGYSISVLISEKNRPKQVNFEQVAGVLNKRGKTQIQIGTNSAAGLINLRTALNVQMSLHQQTNLADILQDRMTVFSKLNKKRLAVFFGKQAVALKQEMRRNLKTFPIETQKSFLKGNRQTYEELIVLLIQEKRLTEALQIINLYQSQEFFDFDDKTSSSGDTLSFTQREKSALDELQKLQSSLRASKENFVNNPDFGKQDKMLEQIETDFGKPLDDSDKIPTVLEATEMQTALSELSTTTKQKTAALYTFIGEDKFYILLITPDGQIKPFESPVGAYDLNGKILEFYSLLQSPMYDPRPLGKKLYDIIFKPLEAELKKQNVQTLMWQLDGNLRYIPMAALFDGEKYLVEHYQNVIFTRTNRERLTRNVTSSWRGTGFGNSQAYIVDLLGDGDKITFSALPGVIQELKSIFRKDEKDSGALSGEIYSDTQFTKNAFYEAMKQRRPLVHIASHFAFRPGDDSRSFLLLGDGKALTLNELKRQEKLFEGVELLALSACNTAAALADANGREIDGFAELAQRLGASAVIATLWQVSDNSTPALMRDFYTARQRQNGTTKAQALRNAQISLLNGTADTMLLKETGNFKTQKNDVKTNIKAVVVPDASKQIRDSVRGEVVFVSEKDAPLFKHDDKKRFAHPYYWSPFVLYGNWK